MPLPWTPDDAVFFRPTDEGAQASIIVDLAALEVEPAPSHPMLVLHGFRLQHPRPDGLCAREEHEACTRVEDRLTALMRDALDGWPVGRVTVGGEVLVAFYGLAEPVRAVDPSQGVEPYTVRSTVEEDPDWSYLRDVLAPDAAERRQIDSLRQLSVLVGQGDHPEAERDVDWTITAADEGAAASIAGSLSAAGYHVSHRAGCVITATALHALELGALLDRQEEVASIAERHGGRYDGWGAPIVDSPPPSRRRGWRRLRT